MIRRFPALLAAMVLALASTPVLPAQPVARPGWPASVNLLSDNVCPDTPRGEIGVCSLRVLPDDVTRLHVYADCLANFEGVTATTALRDYLANGSTEGLHRLVSSDSHCRGTGIVKLSGMLLAGALAEYFLGQENVRVAVGSASAPNAGSPKASGLSDAIRCLLSTDGPDAVALLGSEPFSRRERVHMVGLIGKLPGCLPKGVEFRTHVLALRALLAMAAWMPTSEWSIDRALSAEGDMLATDNKPIVEQTALTSGPIATIKALPTLVVRKPMTIASPVINPALGHIAPDLPSNGDPFDPREEIDGRIPINPETGGTVDPLRSASETPQVKPQ